MSAGDPPVALVAGASRGLGLAVCRELVGRGFAVHALARDDAELANAAAILASEFPTHAELRTHVCDVSVADDVEATVAAVLAHEGRIDVALHVAGIIQVGPLESMTLGHFQDAVGTMLWGPVHLSLSVLPGMRAARRGRIGIVTSVGGLVSVPHLLPYSVAKFGAVGLAEGLAAELAGTGVTATAVVPGLMRSGGHLHARFAGNAEADYAWFSVGAATPIVSISVERAARRIVDGVLAGRPVVDLTPLTMIGRRVHGLAPATTVRLMRVASRLAPSGPGRASTSAGAMDTAAPSVSGGTARRRLGSRVVDALGTLGNRAARRNNETGAP